MKSVYVCLLVFCGTIAIAGCEEQKQGTSLANEGVTADQIAQYEAELAAVQGEDSYADSLEDDEGNAVAAPEE